MTTAYDQLMLDLFTTAIEGGVNYWAQVESYHWQREPTSDESHRNQPADYAGFYANITEVEYEDETDGSADHRIDRGVMIKGYSLARGEWRDKIHWSSGEKPPWVWTEDTDWDFDAGDADCIVQLGLFGEVVYG